MRRGAAVATSARTALVVGTFLVSVNWGSAILRGTIEWHDWWRLLLNYATPFAVAEYTRRRLRTAVPPKVE